MDAKKQIEKLVRTKTQDLVALKAQLEETKAKIARLEAHIEAHVETLKLFPKEVPQSAPDAASFKDGSASQKVYVWLRGHRKPAHIKEIMLGVGITPASGKALDSLNSTLSSYVRREKVFTRPFPNTYGLREFSELEGDDQEGAA